MDFEPRKISRVSAALQDEPMFCLQNQDGRIRVWWHRGERTLARRFRRRPTGPSPGLIVWAAIGYTSRSLLVCIDDTLNSARYISRVLQPVAVPFLPPLRFIVKLWYRVEAALTSIPVHAIHFLFHSMSRRISAVITDRDGCVLGTDF
ncbi:odorant receptor [Trichonephila clavipes]|nr:odorant receptor [Trichonephila clavipes]